MEKTEIYYDREKMEEFKSLCKPINVWLQKNYHPHTTIIIESGFAKIVEDTMGVPFEVLD